VKLPSAGRRVKIAVIGTWIGCSAEERAALIDRVLTNAGRGL
jgi:hypothetical protein